jgi:hypothetical protein
VSGGGGVVVVVGLWVMVVSWALVVRKSHLDDH